MIDKKDPEKLPIEVKAELIVCYLHHGYLERCMVCGQKTEDHPYTLPGKPH